MCLSLKPQTKKILGCLKLAYQQNSTTLKVVYGGLYEREKSVQMFIRVDPLAAKFPHQSPYIAMDDDPINKIDPTGMAAIKPDDWVEDKKGNITWRNDVTSANDKDLKADETYRGTSYQRDKIWSNVQLRGETLNGLMRENYGSDKQMSWENLTPWVNTAFGELGVVRFKGAASNPRIDKYLTHTQLKGKDINDATSWCAGFMNWTLEAGSDVKGTGSALALSFRGNWGQNLEKPAFGSIATVSYGKGKGHVGMVVGLNSKGQVLILGGNQGSSSGGENEVNISPNRVNKFNYHYPKGLTPYYNLPTLNINGKSIDYGNTR